MNTRTALVAFSLLASGLTFCFDPAHSVEIPTDQTQQGKPATIKVLIEKATSKALIEAKGAYQLYNPLDNILIAQSGSSKRQWITPSANGLVWGELIPGNFQVRLVPKDAKSSLLVNGIEYKGCVEVYDIRGELYVVNEIDIERYLKSVMTSQFSSELDDEVMDAVAITARTNAYYTTSRTPVTHWHVDAKEVGYNGYALTLQNLHVDRAVNNTRHMILTHKGCPFPATWTKHSAGKTSDYATIFRKHTSAPQGVEAPFAAREREKSAWQFSISKEELAKALGAVAITHLDLYQDAHSQKVYAVRVEEGNRMRQVDFTTLQTSLSSQRLKSNDFTITQQGNQILFQGYGEGNGVGLCLFSASAMADKGEKAPKILSSFFPETRLERKRDL